MDKSEWVKNCILVLMGALVAIISAPNQQIQAFFYALFIQYIPTSWRLPMGLLLLVGLLIILATWLWWLQKSYGKKSQDTQNELIKSIVKETIAELGIKKAMEDSPDATSQAIKQTSKDAHHT